MTSIALTPNHANASASSAIRTWLLRANAIFLLVAASGGLAADISGSFFALGPQKDILAAAPHTGIGFIEAHGLAFILGVLLWRAPPLRLWHLTAAAIHVLLGTANILFWPLFSVAGMLVVGYVTTALHWSFAAAELYAASVSPHQATRISS
jgi:hypothetical protein